MKLSTLNVRAARACIQPIRAHAVSTRNVRAAASSNGAITKSKLNKMAKAELVELLQQRGLPAHDRRKSKMVDDLWQHDGQEGEEDFTVVTFDQASATRKPAVALKTGAPAKPATKKVSKLKLEEPIGGANPMLREEFAASDAAAEVRRLEERVAALTSEVDALRGELETANADREADRLAHLEELVAARDAEVATLVASCEQLRTDAAAADAAHAAEVADLLASIAEASAVSAPRSAERAAVDVYSMVLPGLVLVGGARAAGGGAVSAYLSLRNALVHDEDERQAVDAVTLAGLVLAAMAVLQ